MRVKRLEKLSSLVVHSFEDHSSGTAILQITRTHHGGRVSLMNTEKYDSSS
jgi:hypothetical protein